MSNLEAQFTASSSPLPWNQASFAVESRPQHFVVADLCCGMGGLALAASQLGMKVGVGVDTNSQALRTFSKNFPEALTVNGAVGSSEVLRRCDSIFSAHGPETTKVIVSGPPCQGFSLAGSRNADDPRNEVLLDVARAISILQPTLAVVENVTTLVTLPHTSRIRQFELILDRSGYRAVNVNLNAADYGVPQKRRRTFFLISRLHLDVDTVEARLGALRQAPVTVAEAFWGLPSPKIRPERCPDDRDSTEIPNHMSMRHSARVIEKIARIQPGSGPMSYRRLHPDKLSNTLFSGHRAPPAHFRDPRSITVREAARLQGFPDMFRIYGSFGSQMQQVSNAVPPPLARAVLKVFSSAVVV